MNHFIFVFNIIIANIFSKCCNYKKNKNKNDFLKDSKKKEIEDEKNNKKIDQSELDKLDEKYKNDEECSI